jgi:hypothetical protein
MNKIFLSRILKNCVACLDNNRVSGRCAFIVDITVFQLRKF